ncbi:hypothetical protein F5Y19DRAFT_487557 [Xylariaceae sp. FL1651]|nr:hypothetical protein F5Y19DRAFT_487557 [Xylariaceae sp. FL1651]
MSNLDYSHIPPDQLGQFLEGPALDPPNGVEPNFEHPENENGPALFVYVFGIVVSTLVLLARFYARFLYLRKGHVVDLLAFSAYVLFLVIVAGSLEKFFTGPGLFVHQWNIQAKNMETILFTIFINTNLFAAGMLLLKTAILWEWIRIFVQAGQRDYFFWSCTCMLTLSGILYATTIVLSSLACQPFKRTWDRTIPGHCIDVTIIDIAAAAVNFVLDVSILLLPQRIIWNLNMSAKRRGQVSVLFAVGVSACIFAAARIVSTTIWHLSNDTVYHSSFMSIWTTLEFTSGFFIFSMPAIPMAVAGAKSSAWVSSFQSWAGSVMRSRNGSPWSSESSVQPRSRSYRTIFNPPPAPIQLKSFAPKSTLWKQETKDFGHPDTRILRTVEFATTESLEPDAQAAQQGIFSQAWYLNYEMAQETK